MARQKLLLALSVLGIVAQNLVAQNWKIAPTRMAQPEPSRLIFAEKMGDEGSLPPFPIQKIRTDKHGFLWATLQNRGILRFDGQQAKWFSNDPDQPNSLPDNTVHDFIFDHQNGFGWLATQRGLVRLDPEREQFRTVPFFKPGTVCRAVLETADGQIWANTVIGLARWDAKADSLLLFEEKSCRNGWTGKPLPRLTVEPTVGLTQDPQGRLWFGAAIYSKEKNNQGGFASLDPATGELVFYPLEPGLGLYGLFPFDLENNCLWLGFDGGGLLRFSPGDRSMQRWTFAGKDNLFNFVHDIFPLGNAQFWLATGGGLLFFDAKTDRFSNFQFNGKSAETAQNESFNAIFADPHGAIWLGGGAGLFRIDPLQTLFVPQPFLPPDFQAEAICELPKTGEILLAEHRDDGLLRFCLLKKQTGQCRIFSTKCLVKPVENREVQCLFAASDGSVWVGLDAALGRFDPVSGKFSLLHAPIRGQENGRTTDQMWPAQIAESENGDGWFGTWNSGFVQRERATGQFFDRTFNLDGRGKNLYNAVIHSVLIQKTGNVERFLLGDFGTGLETWQPALGRLLHFDKASRGGPGGNFINALLADGRGQIWVGTEDGLARMTTDTTFEVQKKVQSAVNLLAADRSGRLWLWLHEGLGLYDPSTGFFKIFGEKEGFREKYSPVAPLLADAEGQIWVGGHTVFAAEKIPSTAPTDIQPYISGLKIYGQPQPLPALRPGELPPLVFRPGQEVISIAFGSIAPGRADAAGLQYCLDEGSRPPTWTAATSGQREVTFSHLPGGTYRFRVQTIDFQGNAIEGVGEAVLPFRVVPPFYRAWWFWALCALAGAGAVYFYFKMKQNQRLEQESNRLRIARDLHDEVGSLLSTISILSESALRAVERDLEKSRLTSIGEKTRAAMESMSDIVWAVNPLNDSMPQIIQRMTAFASETLEAAGIALQFSVEPGVEKLALPLEIRKDFYLIFKEAVANCARHSRARAAKISLKKEGEHLVFELRDDGLGLPKSIANSLNGNGLKNMAARAAGIGGVFSIENNLPENGATARLRLPLGG